MLGDDVDFVRFDIFFVLRGLRNWFRFKGNKALSMKLNWENMFRSVTCYSRWILVACTFELFSYSLVVLVSGWLPLRVSRKLLWKLWYGTYYVIVMSLEENQFDKRGIWWLNFILFQFLRSYATKNYTWISGDMLHEETKESMHMEEFKGKRSKSTMHGPASHPSSITWVRSLVIGQTNQCICWWTEVYMEGEDCSGLYDRTFITFILV